MGKANQVQKIYSLSPMQEGVLAHALMDQNLTAYFEHIVFTLKGNLDLDILEKTANTLVERYDIYRTIFVYQKVKKPKQVVLKQRSINLHFEDISHLEESEKVEFVEGFKKKDRVRGFDLTKDVLMRMSVFKTDIETYQVVWSEHLLLRDGWGFGIIAKDFFKIYRQLSNNEPLKLEKVYPFSDYIKWLEKQDQEEAVKYWREYLLDYNQLATLPKYREYHKPSGYEHEFVTFRVGEELTRDLENVAKNNQVTLNTVIQTIWGILLQRYNNTGDVVFGAVVSGRSSEIPGIEKMVGLFINTIPVRVKSTKTETFSSLAKKIHKAALSSQKYDYLPLAEVQSCTELKKGLIDHIVVFENYPLPKEIENLSKSMGEELTISNAQVDERTGFNFNVEITIENELVVKMYYNRLVYDKEFVKTIEGHFKRVANQIIVKSDISISQIDILTEKEREQILDDFNNTKTELAKVRTIHELFEEQVEKTPKEIAIIYENQIVTYEELNRKANQLAFQLRDKGVGPEIIVGLMTERSIEMIVGILGILKAGGVFLPIDPQYPIERIKYMLEDCNAGILLIQKHLFGINENVSVEVIDLEDNSLYQVEGQNLDVINNSTNLAYLIYTSGSTGKPKAVMVEHAGVVNILLALQKKYPLLKQDAYLLKTAYTFDVSVTELFGWFLDGGKVVILKQGEERDPKSILNVISEKSVTHINFVPSMLNAFINLLEENDIEKLRNLKYVFVAGEAISRKVVKSFYEKIKNVTFENLYGPTESTIYATGYSLADLKDEVNVPIGKPMPNIQTYVIDRNKNLQPIGVAGELVLSGAGLTRGYLNRNDLTGEKFVSNPFNLGQKMYKTGDLVRWLPDGNIEFLGRIDHQVKIRGFRIELGEIENQLLNHDLIKEAVVIAKNDQADIKYLCAYVVSDNSLDASSLRGYLLKVLPEYMIPSYFIRVDKLPVTASGKIDRKSLFELEGTIHTGKNYEPPRNELEEKIVELWQKVLEIEQIGINDSFFELGGHSIKAIQIVSNAVNLGIQLKINDIFQCQTVKCLSEHLTGTGNENENLISDCKEGEKLIFEKLKLLNKLYCCKVENKNYNILILEDMNITQSEIMNLIKEYFDESIYPHYIRYKQGSELKSEMNQKDFSKALDLEVGCTATIWEGLYPEIERMQTDFSQTLLSNRVIGKHSIAPIQKYHLMDSEFEMVGTIIRFDDYLNGEVLQRAVLHLLRTEELLRCVLIQENNEWLWKEYLSPEAVTIPYIDISNYSIVLQNEILQKMISEFYYKEYEIINSLPYRILLVKENMKDHLLILPFSHVAYDIMSSEILRSKVLKYYNYYKNEKAIANEQEHTYWDYIAQVKKGPQDISDEEIVELFEMDESDTYLQKINEIVQDHNCNNFTRFDIEIEKEIIVQGDDVDDTWQKTFALINNFCGSYFSISKVPLWVVNYGRYYEGKSYFNTVGEFIDIIPLLIDRKNNAIENLVKYAQDRIKLTATKNINFANLIFEEDNASFSETSSFVKQHIKEPIIMFNFQGKFEEQDLQTVKELIHDNMVLKNVNKIMFEVKYTESIIRIDLMLPYEEDIKKLQQIFEMEINKIL